MTTTQQSARRRSTLSLRQPLAELLGTFVLVFGGVGAAVIAGEEIGFLGIAFAFGLSLLAMAYAIGPISGCHINPAVTVGLLVTGKIRGSDAVAYVIAQVLGAILAAATLFAIVTGREGGYEAGEEGFGANGWDALSPGGYGLVPTFLAEVVLTAILVFVVLAATDRIAAAAFAGLPIGLVLTLIHLVGIPVDGTSVNPARSIGPALFAGGDALEQLWLFLIAPTLGAVIAALLYGALFAGGREVAPSESAVERSSGPAGV